MDDAMLFLHLHELSNMLEGYIKVAELNGNKSVIDNLRSKQEAVKLARERIGGFLEGR